MLVFELRMLQVGSAVRNIMPSLGERLAANSEAPVDADVVAKPATDVLSFSPACVCGRVAGWLCARVFFRSLLDYRVFAHQKKRN